MPNKFLEVVGQGLGWIPTEAVDVAKSRLLLFHGKVCSLFVCQIFFFFLLDRWAWGPIHCLAHKKISIYSRDETTNKWHFPGIARRVEEDWNIVNIYSFTRVGVLVSFILLLSFFGLAGLLVSGIDHHFGGGPVPREFANLWLKQQVDEKGWCQGVNCQLCCPPISNWGSRPPL